VLSTRTRKGAQNASSHVPGSRGLPGARSPRQHCYLEDAPIRVQGHVTGWLHDFSGIHPIGTVDARDAPALLRTRLFRQA